MSRYSGFVPVYLSSCDSVDLTSVWTCLLEVLKYFYGVYSIKFLSWSPAINRYVLQVMSPAGLSSVYARGDFPEEFFFHFLFRNIEAHSHVYLNSNTR